MSAGTPRTARQQAGELATVNVGQIGTSKRILRKAAIGLLANEYLCAALIFLFTRAVALVGAYSGTSQLVRIEPYRNKGWFAELALMWDSAWYINIVEHGYNWQPGAQGGTNIAFPPFYPLLIRVLSTILGWVSFGWDWGNQTYGTLIAAGLLISNASFFVALALLIRLLTPALTRGGAALVALILASSPLAFFFSAIYTEGLFLLIIVAALCVARSEWRNKWLAVASLGILASLLRFTGVLLLPVLLVEYLAQHGWRWRMVRRDVLWLGLAPAGLAIYMIFLWWHFGTPQALLDTQYKGWHHEASFFLGTYWDDGVVPLWSSLTGAIPAQSDWVLIHGSGNRLYAFLDVLSPLVLLAGGIAARAKLGAAEWTWLLLGILFPLSSNTTNSLARYMLPLWPGLVWLGLLRGRWKWVAVIWILLSIALLGWCARIFGSAEWIG